MSYDCLYNESTKPHIALSKGIKVPDDVNILYNSFKNNEQLEKKGKLAEIHNALGI